MALNTLTIVDMEQINNKIVILITGFHRCNDDYTLIIQIHVYNNKNYILFF